MTTPKYATRQHREQRAHWKPIVEAGQADCSEPICLMGDRWIQPGTPWDVSHDPTGTEYIGPSHATCNRTEGARRGAAQKQAVAHRPSLWWTP